jgi:hypothetical protein
MIYLLALLPATALTIAGYFVLYLSARTEGTLRSFGRYLAFWAFTLAGLVILGALFAAAHHRHYCPNFGGPGMYGHPHGPLPEGHPPLAFPEERRGGGPDAEPPAPESSTPKEPSAH